MLGELQQEKLEAQKQWNANPCGSGTYLEGLEYGSRSLRRGAEKPL